MLTTIQILLATWKNNDTPVIILADHLEYFALLDLGRKLSVEDEFAILDETQIFSKISEIHDALFPSHCSAFLETSNWLTLLI